MGYVLFAICFIAGFSEFLCILKLKKELRDIRKKIKEEEEEA